MTPDIKEELDPIKNPTDNTPIDPNKEGDIIIENPDVPVNIDESIAPPPKTIEIIE